MSGMSGQLQSCQSEPQVLLLKKTDDTREGKRLCNHRERQAQRSCPRTVPCNGAEELLLRLTPDAHPAVTYNMMGHEFLVRSQVM